MLDATRQRPLRVCLVTGSPDAGRCGIHDYTVTLASALKDAGLVVEVIDHRDWSIRGTLALFRKLKHVAPDVLQMQYPMIVGWRSLGPHGLNYLNRIPQFVTLHEYTTFDRLRRASLGAFALSASRIVMTTRFEAERFLAAFPWARRKTSIIPIGSNIPFRADPDAPRDRRTIVYFGQIKPMKGLEEFLDLVAFAAARDLPWVFQVVGAPVTWAGDYVTQMRRRVENAPVAWLLDRDNDETARLLSEASAAYLPYPDGASERRGSLVAGLGNGVPVVTTRGLDTPADMAAAVVFAGSSSEAGARLESLFSDPAEEGRLRRAGPAYVRRFDWSAIAKTYAALYQEALAVR